MANDDLVLEGVAHDTLLESYVLESHKPHDMDNLARRHLNLDNDQLRRRDGQGRARIPFEQVGVERATEYAAEDADITLRLHRTLHPAIAADAKLDYIYAQIEMPVRGVLFRMERNGILIDSALLAQQSRELGERVMALEQQAHQLAGQPFNLGSPKQLGEILFQRMNLPVVKKTATGQPSTDEEVLQELAADYPLPKVLLEHRSVSKLKSTYTDKLPQMVNARHGRVHTTFAQATAVTGRLASSDPNLQNIPVRTAEGRRIREAFIAPPGHVLVSADYSQIELRIMAHLSEDPALVKAFHAGQDIHRATAGEIFGVPPADVTTDQRRYIKAVNFGLIYGMGAFGLAQQLGIERGAAQQFIDKYFARYPGVAEYMQRTRETAREQGYVETVFGRRLWLPDIKAAGGPRRAGAERAAINAPMQGTAADLIKLAMIAVQGWLDRERLATKLLLQVHDELVLEVPAAEVERVRARVAGPDDRRGDAARAAGGRRRCRRQLGTGALKMRGDRRASAAGVGRGAGVGAASAAKRVAIARVGRAERHRGEDRRQHGEQREDQRGSQRERPEAAVAVEEGQEGLEADHARQNGERGCRGDQDADSDQAVNQERQPVAQARAQARLHRRQRRRAVQHDQRRREPVGHREHREEHESQRDQQQVGQAQRFPHPPRVVGIVGDIGDSGRADADGDHDRRGGDPEAPSARFHNATRSSGTKCGALNPSKRCDSRNGWPRRAASQPNMMPPRSTGLSSHSAIPPMRGTSFSSSEMTK